MDPKQKRAVFFVFALVLIAWLGSLGLLSRREPAQKVSASPLSFDGARAYEAAREFVQRFPRRVLGSLESRQSTGFLHDRLEEMGYAISYTHFDARVARRKVVGRNVIGFKQGKTQESLVLIANFDTAPTTVQGAMANGSAVGVLLELARVFSSAQTRRSLLIIFSDGGEYGSLGAKDIVENYPGRDRIVAVLSLNRVAPGSLAAISFEETGQRKGASPPWLRQLAYQAAAGQGLAIDITAGLREHFERAFFVSLTDQGPFSGAGIPAINLGSRSSNETLERNLYHSDRDTIENITREAIGTFGLTAERIVRSLDEMPTLPGKSPESFRLWDARYWGPNTVIVLHVIAFLPLVVTFWLTARDHHDKLSATAIRRELLVTAGTVLPFWALLVTINLIRALRRLPTFSLYPGTAGDPTLTNIPWNTVGTILGTACIVAVVCALIGVLAVRELPKPDFYASKLVLCALMVCVVAAALIYNSYWAVLFLLLPAWLWPLIGKGASLRQRLTNAAWVVAAAIPSCVVMAFYYNRMGFGKEWFWYHILALGSGLFTTAGFYLSVVAAAVGIRFLVIQFRENVG